MCTPTMWLATSRSMDTSGSSTMMCNRSNLQHPSIRDVVNRQTCRDVQQVDSACPTWISNVAAGAMHTMLMQRQSDGHATALIICRWDVLQVEGLSKTFSEFKVRQAKHHTYVCHAGQPLVYHLHGNEGNAECLDARYCHISTCRHRTDLYKLQPACTASLASQLQCLSNRIPGENGRWQGYVVPQGLGPIVAPAYGVGSCQDGCAGIQGGLPAPRESAGWHAGQLELASSYL